MKHCRFSSKAKTLHAEVLKHIACLIIWDLGIFFMSDNVLRLNSEAAIKRFSNLIIGVAIYLKFSLINAGQLHRLRDSSLWRRNGEMREGTSADGP